MDILNYLPKHYSEIIIQKMNMEYTEENRRLVRHVRYGRTDNATIKLALMELAEETKETLKKIKELTA